MDITGSNLGEMSQEELRHLFRIATDNDFAKKMQDENNGGVFILYDLTKQRQLFDIVCNENPEPETTPVPKI